jgi:hypothetical protein
LAKKKTSTKKKIKTKLGQGLIKGLKEAVAAAAAPAEKPKEELKTMDPIDPGLVTLAMSQADLAMYINLMHVCAQTFEKLAATAAEQNEEASFNVYAARYKLTINFAQQLAALAKVGEPENRNVH